MISVTDYNRYGTIGTLKESFASEKRIPVFPRRKSFKAMILVSTLWVALPTLLLALLSLQPAAGKEDIIREFKSWFRRYKAGKIDLYQKSPVPIQANGAGGEMRYFKTDSVREMDGLLQALAKQNNVAATKLLIDAATFRFERREDVEIRKHFEKQPWILRTHASDALFRITDTEALEWIRTHLLESRSLWDSTHRRALGILILGTAGDDPSRLITVLKDPDEKVREAGLNNLQRNGTIRQIDSVYMALEDKSEAVRVAAIEAIGGILINDRNAHPSLFYSCLDRVYPTLNDPSWSVRDAALSHMETFRSVRSIPLLIALLEEVAAHKDKYRERTFRRIIEVLCSLSGKTSPGTDPAQWKEWWKANKNTFILPSESSTRPGYQTGTAQFFSIPVHSDCVVFVLDISGSMSSPISDHGGGKNSTKMKCARSELSRTLGDLHPNVKFNVILFNDDVSRLSKSFLRANPANLESAARFFGDTPASGGTNLFDALNEALELENFGLLSRLGKDVECDTVFLLSDGVPSTGLVINPDEIIEIITRANGRKRIRIHTIYFGAEPSPFMQKLAEKNFGRYAHMR